MGSKNNPQNRGAASKGKTFNGKAVKPVLYVGSHVGHGKYIAAQYEDGQLVSDKDGKPVLWDSI